MSQETLHGNPYGESPSKKTNLHANVRRINWEEEYARMSPEERERFAPMMEKIRQGQQPRKEDKAKKEAEKARIARYEEREKNIIRNKIQMTPHIVKHPVQLNLVAQMKPEKEQASESHGWLSKLKNWFS